MKYLKVWTDFENVLSPLNDDEIGRLFLAMLRYAKTGEEPDSFVGNESFLWPVAKRDIDMTSERAEILRQNGLKGGRPKASESNENQNEPKETKGNQNEPNKSRKEKKGNEIEKKGNENNRFNPPTLEDVTAYMKEIGCDIDPQYFLDYQEARNWILSNGKKAKDWKAVIRTWAHNNISRQKPQTLKTVPAQNYTQRDYSDEQAEAMARMLKGAG